MNDDPAPRPSPARRLRKWFIATAMGIGLCEALTMSPWITWAGVPEAVQMPINLLGFGAFIVLMGPFGNAAAAVGLFLVARLRWRWPPWRCLAVAGPFVYVTCRLSPKPW